MQLPKNLRQLGRKPKTRQWTKLAALVVVLLLAISPFYIVAILIMVAVAARWRPRSSQFFNSYTVRFVVSLLLFGAITMAAGMYCWLFDVVMHPLLPLGAYAVVVGLICRFVPRDDTNEDQFFSFEDGLSATGAALGLLILVASFFLPQPSTSASVQLVTNGFDNGAHLSLIQTTYEHNGYVYGNYDDIKDAVAWKTLTAYPQGWHLANAVQWRGLGLDLFNTTDRSLALNVYVVTILVWQFAAIYLFGRVALYITRLLGIKRLRSASAVVGFFAVSMLMQLVVFWGSLQFGFSTFIGAICYFMLLIACLLEAQALKQKAVSFHWVLAGLSTMAIGLSWLFPVFAALGIFGAMLLTTFKNYSWRGWHITKQKLLYAMAAIAMIVPIISIVLIARAFTVQPDQINDHGGIFGLSNLLMGAIVLFCLYMFMRTKGALQTAFLAIITPQLVFVGLIYIYQFFTIGHTEYFFTKSVALLLCIVGVFFVAAFIKLLNDLAFKVLPVLSTVAVASIFVISIVVMSGQDPASINVLLQQKSQVKLPTARVYADLARNGDIMNRHVITFTKLDYGGDVNANVLSNALNPPKSTCLIDVYWLVYAHRGKEFPAWVNRCAKPEDNITIITSPETHQLIADLHNPAIRTILAK